MRLALPSLPAALSRSLSRSRLRTPRWGVHPEDHKRPAADAPVRRLPLPRRLYLPLQQHVGQPARPIVLVGQTVRRGELIAEASGRIGAPVHASASGRVVAIGEITAPHPSGLPFTAITLETARDEPPSADVPTTGEATDPFALAPDEVTARIAAAGVVGLGGATFPSSVKLALGRKSGIDTLIVNGGECEPYLSCDDRLMRDHAAGVVDGVRLMLHCTGARRALVGIETNKPEAIAAMRRAAAAFPPIRIVPVPSRYPMGSDRQLIETLTGKEVPSDCRAADVGVIVHNVHTAYAAHRAVRIGEPLVERLVTINGGAAHRDGRQAFRRAGRPARRGDRSRGAGRSGAVGAVARRPVVSAHLRHAAAERGDRLRPARTRRGWRGEADDAVGPVEHGLKFGDRVLGFVLHGSSAR